MTHAAWRLRVIAAFAALYLIWGSTYLAIHVGVHAMPPLLFGGIRFTLAGLVMTTLALTLGQRLPHEPREWRVLAMTGLLLFTFANGLIVVGMQWVPTNLSAILIASAALWIAGFGAIGPQGDRLSPTELGGLFVGFAGVAVLLWPGDATSGAHDTFPAYGLWVVAASCVFWAIGTIYVRRRRPATPLIMAAALKTLFGGVFLMVLSLIWEGAPHVTFTPGSLLALAYLVVFGSLIAFTAFSWLVHEVSPALLGTYAYVNPVVAVVLGAWFLDETLSTQQWLGTGVILLGVALVTAGARRPVTG